MYICKYCKNERKNKPSLTQHEIRCNLNPNKLPVSRGNTGGSGANQWTKGKETGKPYILSEESRKRLSAASLGRKHSEETKAKLSKIRKKYLEENPDKVPYKLNHYSNGPSYPEIYWKAILDSKGIKYQEQYQISLYSLDFAILDKKIDLEIDGEQHYKDKRIVDSDEKRTTFLENDGWTVIRVRWAEYQKLDIEDRKKYVDELTEKLKGR